MTGRVLAVTGGASGIGLAVAEAAVEQGWRVAIGDLDTKGLNAAAERFGPAVGVTQLDVTDEAAVEAWIAGTAAQGRLEGLVTSAGIAREVPVLDTPVDLFRRVLEINVTGTFLPARAAARRMRAHGGGGAIVTLGSISGITGGRGRAAYGASKGAVVNLTRVLAVDLAQYGIRANCLCPGPVETPMVRALTNEAERTRMGRRIPMRRFAAPEEIAQMALVLLDSARSGFVTGQVVAVDGGFVAAGIMSEED